MKKMHTVNTNKNHGNGSVIIPSYNSAKTIEYSIENLFTQSAIDRIVEIIVVDSSDDFVTEKILRKYENEGKIIYINSGIRVMPAIQRNIGVQHACGDVLLFIDADAYPEKYWAENIFKAYDDGWMAGGGSYILPDFQKNDKLAKAQYYLECNLYLDRGKPRIVELLPSCNLYCDKELFLNVGGFPEIRASEDALFGLRISRKTPMIFLPDAKMNHIFRDQVKQFYDNQVLLGKYIFIYRRIHYNHFYYKHLFPYLFIPFFLIFKFFRIYIRIVFSGFKHIKDFHSSATIFFKGFFKWSQGFLEGIKDYRENKIKYAKTELN
ncbi:MAG: glycosyltransferase [Bacteroidales bacterium]